MAWGADMPGSAVGAPVAHPRLNKMAGIELLGQKYFTWGTFGGGGRTTHIRALQGW